MSHSVNAIRSSFFPITDTFANLFLATKSKARSEGSVPLVDYSISDIDRYSRAVLPVTSFKDKGNACATK